MKMLFSAEFPHEPFNALVRNGSAGKLLFSIIEDLKPEAVYFTEQDGKRGVFLVIEVAGASDIPRISEPFFLKLNADCRFRIVMTPKDLEKAGLETLGIKWE